MTATRAKSAAPGRVKSVAPTRGAGSRAAEAPARVPRARSELTPTELIGLQRAAGNHAVAELMRTIQRVGGWSDADTKAGSGLAPGEEKTGWNTGEHAVGSIRRIPIDGLVSGMQGAAGDDGGKTLTKEEVGGTVTGPARSDASEKKGRGRAIALVSSNIKAELPVDVLFHFHGNTENKDRGFAGWRQHKDTGKVRDVERDRIAQQIEASASPQLVGILPMGLNQSQFGAISPDTYIRDAFDRLAEIGAWKSAPKDFRVVLSAHSGGGFSVEKMLRGRAGYQLPQKLGMIILFEANNNTKSLKKGEVPAFQAWALSQLNAHLAYLTSTSHTSAEKTAYLAQAPRLRAFFDPRKGHSYGSTYRPIREAVAAWLAANGRTLGAYLPEVSGLIQVVEQEVGHEGQMRAGLGSALSALPTSPSGGATGSVGAPQPVPATPGGTAPPKPVPATPGGTGTPTTDSASVDARAAAITAAMVAAQAGSGGEVAKHTFTAGVGAGMSKLAAAAAALSAAGVRGEIDVTDGLFALVRPELGGSRIPADRNDLKREWRGLRSAYAKPAAVVAVKETAQEGVPVPVTKPVAKPGSTKTPDTTPTADSGSPPPKPTAHGTPEEEYASFNSSVKGAFGKSGVKRYLAVRELYRTRKETAGNPAEWLNQLQFGVAFCGTKLYGVHPKLVTALSGVDEEVTRLAVSVRAANSPVVFQGDFQPRAVTGKPDKLSDHALGLALHLNYKNNPYVGRNEAASKLIARLAAEAGQKDFWSSVGGSGRKTSQARVEEIYHNWAAASDAVSRYFHEMEALEIRDKAGELNDSEKAELAKRRKEYTQLRDSDLAKHRDPKNGVFMHTTSVEGDPMLQIIKQLTGVAGLEWGGTYASRPKDLHHFALK